MRCCSILALSLTALFVGCSSVDNGSSTSNEDGVHIASPENGSTITSTWQWTESADSCNWEFRTQQQVFAASVSTEVPGGVHTARVFRVNTSNGQSYAYGDLLYPQSSLFEAQYASWQDIPTVGASDSLVFYVEVEAGDGSTWTSPATHVWFVGMANVDTNVVPFSPVLDTTLVLTTSIAVHWCDRSYNEDEFTIFIQNSISSPIQITLPSNQRQYTFLDLEPATSYSIWVRADNQYGSSYSDTLNVITDPLPIPDPPTDVTATPITAYEIMLNWQHGGNIVTQFKILRRDVVEWALIDSVPAGQRVFADLTVVPDREYYYKVGAQSAGGIAWSLDSAQATTPSVNVPPAAPSNFMAEQTQGLAIHLSWSDNSVNEVGFHISRSTSGGEWQLISTVGANIEDYSDSLGIAWGSYRYRVRAFNEYGTSPWSDTLQVEYVPCSFGVIPLCLDNWWRYVISDTVGSDLMIDRHILSVDYPTGVDYYLLGAWETIPQQPVDTLYYLRNFADGCRMITYPSDDNPQMLFKYPAAVGEHYVVGEDTMLVASTGTDIVVNGVLYSNCYVYQREIPGPFVHVNTIYVKPLTIGVVFEEEIINDEIVARRSLINYFVQNP